MTRAAKPFVVRLHIVLSSRAFLLIGLLAGLLTACGTDVGGGVIESAVGADSLPPSAGYAAKGGVHGKPKEPASDGASLESSCNPCVGGEPVTFTGTGFDPGCGAATLDVDGTWVSTPIDPQGNIALEWGGFDIVSSPQSIRVAAYQAINPKKTKLMAELWIEVIPEPGPRCGDLVCDPGETCDSCETDCGACNWVFGEQRTLVVLVNFQDEPQDQPLTAEEFRSLVFGSVNDFFHESSLGKVWLSGDVFGWYTIAMNSTDFCDQTGIAEQANLAAQADGADLATYSRFLYAFPPNTCTWAGLSGWGNTWVNVFSSKIIAHELGHSFGLGHARSLVCDTVLDGNCRTGEYGDHLDVMGSRLAHPGAVHKEMVGWLDSGSMAIADHDGIYHIGSYEVPGPYPLALKIPKSTTPVLGSDTFATTYYYLEHREALGFDSFLADEAYQYEGENTLDGVTVRLGTQGQYGTSYLLDMTPGSRSPGDLGDAALTAGNSYTDPEIGMTISVLSVDSDGADVEVTFSN